MEVLQMKLVDIIVYNNERPELLLEYFKDKEVKFIREPNVGLRFMYTCEDKKIYRTSVITRINKGLNYLILDTETLETYIFIKGEENDKNKE
jgi:hypothetical protein